MPITEEDLTLARQAWGDGLIAISKAYEADGIDAARNVANDVLDAAYGYNLGPVLFKPTLASGDQTFRPTKAGALSHIFGCRKGCEEITGVAAEAGAVVLDGDGDVFAKHE